MRLHDSTIFCAFAPTRRTIERAPATQAIAALMEFYDVVIQPCYEPTDYAEALRSVWDRPGDLVIVEHDMAPTVEMVASLLMCSEPQCAQAYRLSSASTGRVEPHVAAFDQPYRKGRAPGNPIEPGTLWASYVGIGLVKISRISRDTLPELRSWEGVCEAVNAVVPALWHMHYPYCPHHHGFAIKELPRHDRPINRSA